MHQPTSCIPREGALRIGIACYPTYGGSGVVATELGAALASRGHQIHFISSSMPFRLSSLRLCSNCHFHEVETVEYPLLESSLYTLALASKVTQLANEEQLDIIHAHYAIPHGAGAWFGQQIAEAAGRPLRLVTTLHGTDITLVGKAPSFQPVVRFLMNVADAVTAVSDWLMRKTQEEFGPTRPIHVIPNFIDPARFYPGAEPTLRRIYARDDEKLLLHISNFRPVKRVQDVVRVFAKVARHVAAQLVMIGDGPERSNAARLARELGVADRVHFPGKQERIDEYLRVADLFLFPSEYESFGLAALEAMSTEVPVIASDGGGLPEVIRDGDTGLLRPVGDVDGMASGAIALLADEEAARAMGRRARADVIERFALERIVPQYEALYYSLVGQPATA